MKKHKLLFVLIGIFVCAICVGFMSFTPAVSNAATESVTVSAKTYEFDDTNSYNFSASPEVSTMTFGAKQLGSLSISGNITDKSTFKNRAAYGVGDDSVVSFSYSYNGALQSSNSEAWNLRTDTSTKVDDIELGASIDKGVLIVQKSYDGSTWVNAANPVTNFYASNKAGHADFYTTSGADVAQGTYYRVILAYQTGRKTGTSGILWWKEDTFENRRHVELYEFYLVINSGTISIHNLAVDESSLPEIEGFTQETIKKAETLLDGSTTTVGFSIDKLGSSYLVNVVKEGGASAYVEDGATFTANGKYTITTITKLGKQITNTIYIFNGGEDSGFATYFSGSIVQGERVFRFGEYPTYGKGACIQINSISNDVPMLTGTITNLSSQSEVQLNAQRSGQKIYLDEGSYCVDFYSGETTSGTVYHYMAYFNVIDEKSAPYVNYYELSNTYRLSDLSAKHYEVAYQMTAGGYIFVCFSLDSYDEAFNYAYEIEKRFIEQTEDGLYYKSQDNPNVKVKYYDYIAMTSVLNYYARKNVEYNYFNPIDEFTYYTCEDNSLDELEAMSQGKSIKVFSSQEEKDKLIKRKPFINDFTFIQVADYDVVSVNAYCHKNGKNYSIEFNKDVSKQLTVSSKYTITETNVYGGTKVYDVYYVNENQTKSSWKVTKDGTSTTVNVSSDALVNDKIEITADTVSILSISNQFDEDSIVTLKAPDVYSFEIKCSISELKNVGLYKKGKYELTFVDRVGNSYRLIINITGKARYADVISDETRSYTNLYNGIYLNSISEKEEIIYDASMLKKAIDRIVDANMYTSGSYDNYTRYLQEARVVYENSNASQEEINNAALNLEKAYASLVKKADKAVLSAEIDKFRAANSGLYTTASYNVYKTAYDAGVVVFAKEEPSADEIALAVQSLQDAFSSLVLRGDKSLLYAKMQEIHGVDCLLYTPNSVEALNKIYERASLVFANIDATQSEIDSVINLLTNQKVSLVRVADFSGLLSAIEQVQSINAALYTTETSEVLKTKYNDAVAVYKDRNNTQSVVDAAKNALIQAKNALVPCGNLTGLKALTDEIATIPYMIYSKETIFPLLAKYNEALAAMEGRYSQTKIDAITVELLTLKSGLVVREDKQDLYDVLCEMAQMDMSGYSKEEQEAFLSAYNAAMETLCSLDSTEEQISSAKQGVELAKNELDSKANGLKWWVIVLICVGSLIVVGAGQVILYVLAAEKHSVWLWLVCIATLAALLIFAPWSWWVISLVEFGVIAVTTIILFILEELL